MSTDSDDEEGARAGTGVHKEGDFREPTDLLCTEFAVALQLHSAMCNEGPTQNLGQDSLGWKKMKNKNTNCWRRCKAVEMKNVTWQRQSHMSRHKYIKNASS